MTIDFTKPVQTRDGRKVRILCTDAPCVYYDTPQPIVGIIEGNNFLASWCVDGSYALGSYHNNDLISASAQKKKALVTVRLYRCPQQGVYPAVAIEGQRNMTNTEGALSNEQLLLLLISSAYAAYSSSLIGGPQIANERFRFFKNFKPGDLVMEVSSMHARDRHRDSIRIGYLVRDAMEPVGDDEWWEEHYEYYDGERPKERVYTIRSLLDGKEKRWTNAMMVRVVTDIREFP